MTSARGHLTLTPGELVTAGERGYRIDGVLNYESVVAVDLETGHKDVLKVADLAPLQQSPQVVEDLESIADADLRRAQVRYEAIKPLLSPDAGRKAVEKRAVEVHESATTLYRWRKRYLDAGSVEGLVAERRGVKRGTRRLSLRMEQIIDDAIRNFYLTVQRPNAQKVVDEVKRQIVAQNLSEHPHPNTIRARIADVDPRTRLRARGEKEHARNRYDPVPGSFPNADYPLAVVQIDHTPVDLDLVDDISRLPIGRPWLTLAIDVYSRMVVGYYLSFDAPSATSVAMCVAHAVLPKAEWLTLHGVDAVWPVQGIMDKIHVDNGSDFRSEAFRTACMMHGIDLEYRPVARSHFGGHIERLLGTFMHDIHTLPGTMFSSSAERGEYVSDQHAALTKSEFEKWLVTYICKFYHKRLHRGIGLPPEEKWRIGILGNAEHQGCGLRPIPVDRHAFLLDFMPSFRRTVQPRGVAIDGLHYYADVLRSRINASDSRDADEKQHFIFRRDPRDISVVWFHDPDVKQYFRIPFADQSLPTMSIWEYREARKRARDEGERAVDERGIARALDELREQVDASARRTKSARRARQRRSEHAKAAAAVPPPMSQPVAQAAETGLSNADIPIPEDIA